MSGIVATVSASELRADFRGAWGSSCRTHLLPARALQTRKHAGLVANPRIAAGDDVDQRALTPTERARMAFSVTRRAARRYRGARLSARATSTAHVAQTISQHSSCNVSAGLCNFCSPKLNDSCDGTVAGQGCCDSRMACSDRFRVYTRALLPCAIDWRFTKHAASPPVILEFRRLPVGDGDSCAGSYRLRRASVGPLRQLWSGADLELRRSCSVERFRTAIGEARLFAQHSVYSRARRVMPFLVRFLRDG
jgi:hypothetical protein